MIQREGAKRPVKIIVMRHGQSEADILRVIEGRADFALTPLGIRQAGEAARRIAQLYPIGRIYASTLRRAAQTAEILRRATGASIEWMDDLMEFDNGLIAGLPHEEANQKYPKDDALPFDQAMYGMESMKAFRERAERALRHILSVSQKEDAVAIVSHGGMINRLYQSFLRMPLHAQTSYPTGDAGYHVWQADGEERAIVSSNNRAALGHE